MSKKPLVIWFDQNGNLLEQAYNWSNNPYGYQSEEAKDFDDSMEVVKLQEYRRKNTRVILQSVVSGRKYSMYADDFNELLEKKKVHNLLVEGTFHFIKKSSGQAVKLLLP